MSHVRCFLLGAYPLGGLWKICACVTVNTCSSRIDEHRISISLESSAALNTDGFTSSQFHKTSSSILSMSYRFPPHTVTRRHTPPLRQRQLLRGGVLGVGGGASLSPHTNVLPFESELVWLSQPSAADGNTRTLTANDATRTRWRTMQSRDG